MKKILRIAGAMTALAIALAAQNTPPNQPAPAPAPVKAPVAEPVKPVEKPAQPAAEIPSKPATPVTPASPADVKPPSEPLKPGTDAGKPATIEPKKEEPELDPETKRLIEEAKQKILREKAEKEAAEKRAAEEAARKKEAEKSFFGYLAANSKLRAGATAGLGLSLNNIHATGFAGGITVDYLAFEHYGFHFGTATGQFSAKSAKLTSGNGGTTFNIPEDGTFGFLAFDFAAVYTFPRIAGFEPAAGLGISLYQLQGGNYSFGALVAPLGMASVYYNVLERLQVGVVWKITVPTANKLKTGNTDYDLDTTTGLTTMSLQLAVRYSLF
jgi:hypothetical protein